MTKTVLIVEDDSAIADFLSQVLKDMGYTVLRAENGLEGLARLAHGMPDLVLSDYMMPVMDGRAFCQALRSDPRYSSLPIVLMSAVDRQTAGDIDYNTFLRKPFSLANLLQVVDSLLKPEADG